MKILKLINNNNPIKNELHISLIDNNNINVKLYEFKKLDDEFKPTEEEVKTLWLDKNYSINDLNKFTSDHSIIVLSKHNYTDENSNSFKLLNLLNYTKSHKLSTGSFIAGLNLMPLVFFYVPFKGSNFSDITLVCQCTELHFNDTEVTETFNIDVNKSFADSCAELLPNLTLSKNGDKISAQLDVSKEGVEIYFETTAGYLNKTRALTDATGKATVKLFGDELEGKVKAGFKHFSGKTEITI
jgi:hypothetical protein